MTATINKNIKQSKNKLSHNTWIDSVEWINDYLTGFEKFKPGDILYIEMSTMSYVIKLKKVANYNNKLSFEYTHMLNRLDRLYKDSWCACDHCRFATNEEIKLLTDKIK